MYFDLVDHDKVSNFRIQKQMPFNLSRRRLVKNLVYQFNSSAFGFGPKDRTILIAQTCHSHHRRRHKLLEH